MLPTVELSATEIEGNAFNMAGERGNAHIVIDLEARAMAQRAELRISNHESACMVRQQALMDKLKDLSDDQGGLGEKIDAIRRSGTNQLLALCGGLFSICGVLIWNFVIHPT